ncbi:MAG: hypothetical protein WAW45_01280, partial [Atribacterota bacterium]
DVLEEHGNVADDKDVKDLIDKIMEELFPKIVPTPPTKKAVTDISVKTQPTRLRYIEGQDLELFGLVVTLTYNDASTEDVTYSVYNFNVKGITADPADGTPLSIATHHNTPVLLTHTASSKTDNTNNLTVVVAPPAPTIASHTKGKTDTDSTSTSITVPADTQNGDLMILFFTINGDTDPGTPDGWTRLRRGNNESNVTVAIYYKQLTESLSDFNVTHTNARTSWILLRIPDGDIPESTFFKTGQSIYPYSFWLFHGFGKGTNVLWIAHASWTQNNSVTGWPTYYDDNHYSVIASDTSGNSTAVATRTTNNTYEDPYSFALSPSTSEPYWCAFKLAVKLQY